MLQPIARVLLSGLLVGALAFSQWPVQGPSAGSGGGGAVSSVTAGPSGCVTVNPTTGATVVDLDTLCVPNKNGAESIPGHWTFTQSAPQIVSVQVFNPTEDAATGDGKFYWPIPAYLNGLVLSGISGSVVTVGTTGTMDIQVARCATTTTGSQCSGTVVDMLSTKLTIDSNENKSSTAATPAAINTSNDDVTTDYVLRFDVDAVHSTPAKGLTLTLVFSFP